MSLDSASQPSVIIRSEKSQEKLLGFGLITANLFVWHLGGELRIRSYPWIKTETIFSIPIKLELSRAALKLSIRNKLSAA